MMTLEEIQRYLKLEEKKLQEVKGLNEAQAEYVKRMKIKDEYPYIPTLTLETTVLTLKQVIDEKLTEQELLQILEEENSQMYDLDKSFQKVSNYLRDLGQLSVPVPIQYLRARTNTIKRVLQSDVSKAFR